MAFPVAISSTFLASQVKLVHWPYAPPACLHLRLLKREAQNGVPPLVGDGLYPVVLLTSWRLGTEVDVVGTRYARRKCSADKRYSLRELYLGNHSIKPRD